VIGLRIGPEGLEPEKEGLPSRSLMPPTPGNLTGVADRHRGHLLPRHSLGGAWVTLQKCDSTAILAHFVQLMGLRIRANSPSSYDGL
jgi:hypothetical protein